MKQFTPLCRSVFLLLLLLTGNLLQAQVIYITPNGAGTLTGASWANAAPGSQLQNKINGAASGSQLWVAAGTYKPNAFPGGCSNCGTDTRNYTFQLKNNLAIYGGFSGVETNLSQRNLYGNETILSGDIGTTGNNSDNCYHVMIAGGVINTSVLDGFTIRDGNANGANNYGYTISTSQRFFSNNGGGINMYEAAPIIRNCILVFNYAEGGGGLINFFSSPTIINCVFVSNNSGAGGAISSSSSSSPIIVNSTLTGNTGIAIFNSSSSTSITNSIIWGNSGYGILHSINNNGGTVNVNYTLIQDGYSGMGNLNTDPKFVNSSDADGTDNIFGTQDDGLRLQTGSPAINTGNNADVPSGITTDIAGIRRIQNGTVDMGAYETFVCPSSNKLYVNGGQATSGNGTSWATAVKELREALQIAQYCSGVDSILVAGGTYLPTDNTDKDSAFAILRGGIKIYGGYNAVTGIRNISANPTILSANIGATGSGNDNSYHVLVIAGLVSSADSVVVDGFTIRDGFSPTATGSKTYNGIVIPRTDGAGICLQANNGAGRKITIRNCSILANGGHTNGGISNNASSPAIISCFFSGNYGYLAGGGGIGSYNASSPLIINCAFTNNQGINGGGIFNAVSSSPFITNCTLTANETGISNDGSSPVITNCIVWGNSASIVNTNGSSPAITYSIVQGTSVYPGTGNLNLDPMFTGGSLQLLPGSPAINAGSNAAVPAFVTTDINGAARIQNGVVDMGAYEPGFTCPASHKLYVNSSVAASGDGTSWATAYKQLREAMVNLQFCSNVDSILVAAGTYKPSLNNLDSSFAISRGGLKMIGGYNAATGVRNIAANPTILTGELSSPGSRVYHVVVIAGLTNTADSVVLDGFTITRGFAVGTGSYPYFGTDVPRNAGGGVALYANNGAGGKIAIRNCTITDNIAQTQGGGLCNQASSPTIANCLFTFNTGSNGTAMYNSGAAQPAIINCVFNQNTSGNGAIYNLSCAPVITNCTFSTSLYSVYNNNASPLIINSILWNNRSSAGFPIPGIYNEGSSTPVITNSIIQGGNNGAGGLNIDPLFVNKDDVDGADNLFGTADDGLNLQTSSPAINAGSNAAAATILTDITGSRRIENSIVDIGAYEKFACPVSPVLYVDNSANGNGSSWANALSGLSEALNIAAKCSSITTIYVAKGTYKPTTDTNRDSAFTILRGGLKIYGGYPTGGGNRNTAANPTILSGDIGTTGSNTDNSYHVVVVAGLTGSADSVVIDGFTITGGYANGNGAKNYNGASTHQNEGGGIYLHSNNDAGGKIAVRNCTLNNNNALFYGGGFYNQLSSPNITNCIFTSNSSSIGNGQYSDAGGGLFNYNFSSPTVANCVFTGNNAGKGGAVHNYASSAPRLVNCTIVVNNSPNGGAGIFSEYACTPIVANCIIWSNTSGFNATIFNTNNSTTAVTYSIVQNGYTGTGNINTSPLFVNPADFDGADNVFGTADDGLKLQLLSPAVNAGSNAAIPAGILTDITGDARIQNSTVDMGAYEGTICPTYTTLYVDSSIALSGNGSSWASAIKDLKYAVNAANQCSSITTINVAKGTYKPAVADRDSSFALMRNGLAIYGGYPSGGGIRNSGENPTILSGDIGTLNNNTDNSYHVVVSAGTNSTAVLDGFIIRDGNADGSSTATISGYSFDRNTGGGMVLKSTAPIIINCTFLSNNASSGGGLSSFGGTTLLTNCTFAYNSASLLGGGVYSFSEPSISLANCLFYSNTAASKGGGIYNFTSNPSISGCTFTANSGTAVYNDYSSPTIVNSIIWSNVGSNPGIYNNSGTPVVTYSNVQDGYSGTGNINIAPLFTNVSDADGADNIFGTADDGFRLQAGSAAINTGNNAAIPFGITTDITGAARIQNGTVDMGAYEGFPCPSFATLYVDNNVTTPGNGSSWSAAFKELRDALNAASQCSNITAINVAKGTYKPTSNANRDTAFAILRGGLKIYGGYPTGGGTRNTTANPTILSGDIGTANTSADNSYHVMVIAGLTSSADSLVIDGFTTTSANANGGGGKTYAGITTYQNEGGGIYLHSNNGAGGKIAIRNCTFSNNSVTEWGGGIYNQLSSPTIINCAFTANTARNAAGIFNYNSSSPAITNCVFTGNIALQDGGAIHNRLSSSPAITNCTLFSNGASASGAGIYNNGSSPLISNTVIWGNTGNFPGIYVDNSFPTVTYSDVQGGYTGTGNISIDPLFVNTADADGADNILGTNDDGLRLQSCSPAINGGINTVPNIPATDITSQIRIFNSIADIGAYEYQAIADGSSLAVNGDNGTYNIRGGTNALLIPGCRVMAHLLPNGANPVNGGLTAKIWIDNTQPVFNGKTYIKRHYEFTPAANAATATARITLYTSQQELNAFNSSPYKGNSLPTGPNDFNGIANLRIVKFNGQSSNGTGLPATYGEAGVEIDPDDNNIVWNNSLTRWEISFNVTGFSGFFITNNSGILPLTLLQFKGTAVSSNDALLNWRTANEINTGYFELQRSTDSRSFNRVITMQAKGTTQSETDYSYTDKNLPAGIYYYRLRMVDKDSKETYSQVVTMAVKSSNAITLYPVPAKDFIRLSGSTAILVGKNLQLMDIQGRVLQNIRISQWPQRLDISNLAAGTYLIKVDGEKAMPFIKQ